MNVADDKGADNSVVRFVRVADSNASISGGSRASLYAARHSHDGDAGHEGKGLILAIILCMSCWGALGFFLLR